MFTLHMGARLQAWQDVTPQTFFRGPGVPDLGLNVSDALCSKYDPSN